MTPEYRQECANAYKRAVSLLAPAVECYANSEFWAGWNAAIAHAARIAQERHRYWQESSVGSSAPECDVTACEDIAAAIRCEMFHRASPSGSNASEADAQTGQPS